jgi:hypothetical protein
MLRDIVHPQVMESWHHWIFMKDIHALMSIVFLNTQIVFSHNGLMVVQNMTVMLMNAAM